MRLRKFCMLEWVGGATDDWQLNTNILTWMCRWMMERQMDGYSHMMHFAYLFQWVVAFFFVSVLIHVAFKHKEILLDLPIMWGVLWVPDMVQFPLGEKDLLRPCQHLIRLGATGIFSCDQTMTTATMMLHVGWGNSPKSSVTRTLPRAQCTELTTKNKQTNKARHGGSRL